jgi:hypothetical protein
VHWRIYIKDDGSCLIAGPRADPAFVQTWKASDRVTEMETGDSLRDAREVAESQGAVRSKVQIHHPPHFGDVRSTPE